MNIAFDATAMLADMSKNGDIGKYVYDQFEKILKEDSEHTYFCFNMYDGLLDCAWEQEYSNFHEIRYYSGNRIEILRMQEYKEVMGKVVRDFLKEYQIDLFCITSPFDTVLTVYEKEWFNEVKTVAIVFSVEAFIKKDLFFTSLSIQKKYNKQLEMLRWIDKCLVKCEQIKKEMIEALKFPSEKIEVIENIKAVELSVLVLPNISEKRYVANKRVKKIAFFTPLPPIESGIAYYSFNILMEISQYVDVDVYIDNGYMVDCVLPNNVNVYRHYDFLENSKDYDEIIYQIGNNKYHTYIFDYVKEFQGIIDLHDFNLHMLLDGLYGVKVGQRFNAYKKALREDMSEIETMQYVCRRLSNHTRGAILENEINGFVVNYAKKVIVHNNYAKNKLLKKDITRNVDVIPLYVKLSSTPKKAKEISPIIFAAFGHVQPSKRVIPILKAFERILKDGCDARFMFVGKLNDSFKREYDSYISKESLCGKVDLTGYVSEEEFENLMGTVDIGLNLRYPYVGETSGPLIRLMGMGKCVIINDIGSFSELPDEACIKIPSVDQMSETEEINQIYFAMNRALDSKIRLEIGKKAYNYVKNELDIQIIGKKYINAINNMDRKAFSNEELRLLLKQDRLLDAN